MSHLIANIQKYSVHDGDGIRTTIFFKGCHLNCWWCHNPETQSFSAEPQIDREKCGGCSKCVEKCPEHAVTLDAEHKTCVDKDKCVACGKCVLSCPNNLRMIVGKEYSVKELVKICLQDRMFYEDSGGGVTLSGGEVMAMDNDYIKELCAALRKEDLTVTIDTCGQAPWQNYKNILPYVDTFLYDIKVIDDELHKKYMGAGNRVVLGNLVNLAKEGARIYIRIPVVREVNGSIEAMTDIINFLKENNVNPVQVNLLPYHDTGSHKYAKLGRPYPARDLHRPTDEELNEFVELFTKAGYQRVKIGG